MKHRKVIGLGAFIAVFSLLFWMLRPSPEVYTSFPEILSKAQRKEIPMLVRKEMRRRILAPLKEGRFKAAWTQYRFARSESIIAVGYQPENTNKIWVYLGTPTPPGARPNISGILPMTNANGHWRITDTL